MEKRKLIILQIIKKYLNLNKSTYDIMMYLPSLLLVSAFSNSLLRLALSNFFNEIKNYKKKSDITFVILIYNISITNNTNI